MSQKLTLTVYLEQKGQKAKALKRVEAEAFGIPYPLQSGWPGRHGQMEITPDMLVHIATTPRAKVRLAASASHVDGGSQNLRSDCDINQKHQVDVMRPSPFPGFVVRPALRYRGRRPAQ
jgi:hypothetical protein